MADHIAVGESSTPTVDNHTILLLRPGTTQEFVVAF